MVTALVRGEDLGDLGCRPWWQCSVGESFQVFRIGVPDLCSGSVFRIGVPLLRPRESAVVDAKKISRGIPPIRDGRAVLN